MTAKHFILLATLVALFAPIRVLAQQSPAATAYLSAIRDLSVQPLRPELLADVEANPQSYAGRTIELTGTVTGQVASDDRRVILIEIDQNTSISACLPDSLRNALWIDVDNSIRLLFRIDAPDSTQTFLHLVAAAPESQVALAEQELYREEAAREQTSRFMAYDRNGQTVDGENGQPVAYSFDGGHPVGELSPRARAIFGPYRAAIHHFNPRLDDEDLDKITNSVLRYSDECDVDPRLIVAMIVAESGFDMYSTSDTGAMGLGQLMPETAAGMGVTDAYDPEQNIRAAVQILRGHLDKYGGAPPGAGVIPYEQIRLIMAAYNAGPGAVSKYHGVPPYRETQRYVEKVAGLYRELCGN